MTTRSFTVETRGSCAAIFGGQNALVSALVKEFIARGIHAASVSSIEELNELKQTHDPDYLVLFSDKNYDELIPTFQELVNSGESRIITVGHLETKKESIDVKPISKKILYSDYIGDSEFESPIIEEWLKKIKSHHTLVVPGDGLGEISILGIDDLSKLLAQAILHPMTKMGETLILGNPNPISLLNLAYLLRTNLPFKIFLTFDQDKSPNIWEFDGEIIKENLDLLSYQLIDDPEVILKFYLKNLKLDQDNIELETIPTLATVPIVPNLAQESVRNFEPLPPKVNPIIDKSPFVAPTTSSAKVSHPPAQTDKSGVIESIPTPKRLTPLRAPQPFFVPLQNRKVRKPLSLKIKLPQFPPRIKRTGPPRPQAGPPRIRTIVGRGLVIAIALYLGTLAFAGTIAGLSLKQVYANLQNNELPTPNGLNEFAVTYLRANWVAFTSFPSLSQNQNVSDINLLLDAYSQAISAFRSAQSLSSSAEELTHYIFGSGNADAAQVISLSRLQAEELYQKLSLLDGSLPSEPPSIIPTKYQNAYSSGKTRLGKLKRSITTTKALLATTPDVIGLGGRRKYAVLFQNNMELRATGGFIGSFAILSFENGKLYDMPIYDVYDADGQLKGHVEPPVAIKDILGEANWYLRDSNFDPNFPTSARRAEWFIKKSLNQDLDGTIAVNVNTLISLLKATGPLDVKDYNETITGDNLYERSQFHAEVNFFPGSTQKKEFLSTVADALFTRLPKLDGGLGLKVVGALADTVQEKNTLVALTAPATDRVFKTLGWNGELSDFPCPTSGSCHKDYAMVVDSNFGVNKANYFIKRSIEEIITFDKNLAVNHVLRLSYQNTSTSTAWPAGTYKNYQRLYLPIGSNVTSVKVGDKVLSPKEYTITSEHNKFVIAYLALVPINDKVMVEITYSTPQLSQENELMYTWYWQKQPGTSSGDSIVVYLNYPMYLRPVVISPESELAPQQLKFNMTNDTDHRVTVKFTK